MRRLHNGIPWADEPTAVDYDDDAPLPVPYLDDPPACIDIDVGRQLFVDDFLIEETDLRRQFHAAQTHEASPVLVPETTVELNRGQCPMAAPFNDGLWWDPRSRRFMMWYQAGWFDGTALALSDDGINWERPQLDVVPGSNLVLRPRPSWQRDGCTVWLDDEAPDAERFKMFIFFRHAEGHCGECYLSADGIHWGEPQTTQVKWHDAERAAAAGHLARRMGDNTGFFRDPFRDRWVFSLRDLGMPRRRACNADRDFLRASRIEGPVNWCRLDERDQPDPRRGMRPELYDLQATPYESLMLGTFGLLYGPQNGECMEAGDIKTIDLQLGYSRDGLHWHRPHREAFLSCSRETGRWDNGYLHAVGGICSVQPDALWFHYTGFSGVSPEIAPGARGDHWAAYPMYAGASCGLATLRRDGFASMEAGAKGGELLTRPLRFSGRHLFVNCKCPEGELRVTICDEAGQPIPGFEHSQALSVDRCRQRVVFAAELGEVAGRPVRFRFQLRNGALYAFWVSAEEQGASGGYLAAGGPDYPGQRDIA